MQDPLFLWKNLNRIEAAVKELVGGDVRVDCRADSAGRCITCTIDGPFRLKFEHMPRFAEIFETEHLDFGQTEFEPSHRYSSWTYESAESAKFLIVARYD